MKFYKRFVSDIQVKTGHLTPAEFGVYDRLLDHYYATEAPLPESLDRCCGIARAMTKADQGAVGRVLAEFFSLEASGYRQRRADEMIAEAQPKIEAARTNGKRGGRPKRPKPETQQKPSGFLNGTHYEPDAKASQSQKEITPRPPSGVAPLTPKATKRCPAEFLVTAELQQWAREKVPLVDIRFETSLFRDCDFPKARSDWPAAWRLWMGKEQRRLAESAKRDNRRGNVHDLETPKMRADRIRAEEISPLSARKVPTEAPAQPFTAIIEMEPSYARVDLD